jgi:hypothetical protein
VHVGHHGRAQRITAARRGPRRPEARSAPSHAERVAHELQGGLCHGTRRQGAAHHREKHGQGARREQIRTPRQSPRRKRALPGPHPFPHAARAGSPSFSAGEGEPSAQEEESGSHQEPPVRETSGRGPGRPRSARGLRRRTGPRSRKSPGRPGRGHGQPGSRGTPRWEFRGPGRTRPGKAGAGSRTGSRQPPCPRRRRSPREATPPGRPAGPGLRTAAWWRRSATLPDRGPGGQTTFPEGPRGPGVRVRPQRSRTLSRASRTSASSCVRWMGPTHRATRSPPPSTTYVSGIPVTPNSMRTLPCGSGPLG